MEDSDAFFEESYVLSEVLTQSKQFQQFYDIERGKIKNLKWKLKQDRYHPASIITQLNAEGEFDFTIILNQIPVKPDNDHTIAHEIFHGIINQEKKFPHVTMRGITDDDPKLKHLQMIQASIDSSLHDQLVNLRLSQYFDIAIVYRKTIQRLMRDSDPYNFKRSPIAEVCLSCRYLCNMLLKDMVLSTNRDRKIDNTYEAWFSKTYPLYTSAANDMLEIGRLIDYRIPQNVEAFFNYVLDKYNLRTYFFVSLSL